MPLFDLLLSFLHPQVILFLLFGAGALVTALTMLLHPNPVRAALFLVLNLFCVAVLYLLLNAYFLAAVQVVVYAGAIMVLFLFVIMLLNLGAPDRTTDRLRIQQPLAALAGLVLAGSVGLAMVQTMPLPKLDAAGNPPQIKRPKGPLPRARGMGVSSASQDSVTSGNAPDSEQTDAPALSAEDEKVSESPEQPTPDAGVVSSAEQGTVAGVGKALYNPQLPYLFPFEVTSILLLIATIGSVVLAQRKTPAERSLDTEGTL